MGYRLRDITARHELRTGTHKTFGTLLAYPDGDEKEIHGTLVVALQVAELTHVHAQGQPPVG